VSSLIGVDGFLVIVVLAALRRGLDAMSILSFTSLGPLVRKAL
jgi:hypothetical protein